MSSQEIPSKETPQEAVRSLTGKKVKESLTVTSMVLIASCLGGHIPEHARNAPITPYTASVMQSLAPTSSFRTESHSFSMPKSSFSLTFRWCNITQSATIFACPFFLIRLESIHGFLDLRAQIRAVESFLIHFLPAVLAVPAKTIEAALRSWLLNHNADRIGETNGVVWCFGWQEKHIAFVDVDIAEEFFACIVPVDGLEKHGALILVEPLCCVVDVIICACIWATDDLLVSALQFLNDQRLISYHDRDIVVVDAVIVDWWL